MDSGGAQMICELLPARGGSAGGGGSSAARCSAPWPRRCWAAAGAQPTGDDHTPLGWVLELAEAERPSRLPLRA